MAGEIDLLPHRYLHPALGVGAGGIAGLQGMNRCRNLVALYGDSLVAQAFMDAVGLSIRRAVYNSIGVANALAGQRMIFVTKRAVSGWRSDQLLQCFLSDVADGTLQASGAGTLIFTMGINDLSQASAGYTDAVSGLAVTLANTAENLVGNAGRLIDVCASLGI